MTKYIGNAPTALPLTSADIADGIITSAKIADGTIATADIADANVTSAKLASGTVQNQSAFKNIIINGDMSIAQRATSTSSITGNGYHTIDRYHLNLDTMGTWTQSQSTTVPSGQGFAKSLKMDCTTADASPAASDQNNLQIKLEGQNLQYLKKGTSSAESITCSFWVRSNKTGTYIVRIKDNDNSRSISQSYTISSADTWEKKTLTYAGDTTGTLNNDANISMTIDFCLGAGTTFTSGTLQTSWGSDTTANRYVGQVNLADSTSNEWYITGIQLEAGTSASDFEFLPHDVNEKRCLRYYFVHSNTSAFYAPYTSNDTYNVYWNSFPVPMRAAPTLTETSSRGWHMTNKTRFQADLYRSPQGNYLPPNYTAESEL